MVRLVGYVSSFFFPISMLTLTHIVCVYLDANLLFCVCQSSFNASTPQKAISESLRVLQPGGVLAASFRTETNWLKILRTITKIDPARSPPSISEDWAKAGNLATQLEIAGFRDVEVHEVPVDIPSARMRRLWM
jgi:SAM-dependent methyltransferase